MSYMVKNGNCYIIISHSIQHMSVTKEMFNVSETAYVCYLRVQLHVNSSMREPR